jgi:hypothetical protein
MPTSKSFTTRGDCYFLRIGYRPDDYNINTWILEKGSTATEYEAFTSNSINFPYTLRSLSDEIKDYIEIDNINKTAKLYRNVGVRVYNGTENWIAYPGYTNTFYDSYDVLSDVPNRVSSKNSHFHYEISYTTNSFWIESSGHLVRITNMNFTAVNDFKTWLASEHANGTPVTVIYPLATPTVTDINYDDVITYSPYTQIYTNAIIKPNLEVTYKKVEI